MLFVSFALGTYFAAWRARNEGINPDNLWDIAMYIFVGGVVGSRILSLIVDPYPGDFVQQIWHFFEIWKGGMVFYGGVIGGAIAFIVAYFRVVKPNGLSSLQLADIIAPSLAMGIFFGRIGCFLNGCCFGDVAEPDRVPFAVAFPANSNPHRDAIFKGYQSGYGFYLTESPIDFAKVHAIESRTPAAEAGLKVGDRIVAVGDDEVTTEENLYRSLLNWPQNTLLRLRVERDGQTHDIVFDPPPSPKLHPTQLYSALDGLLLLFVLLAYYPLRKHYGEVMAIIFLVYPLNRFLIEKLRSDTPATYFGFFTLSQAISIGMFALGLLFLWWVRRQPPIPGKSPAAAMP